MSDIREALMEVIANRTAPNAADAILSKFDVTERGPVARGLAQSAAGDVLDLGDFTQYAAPGSRDPMPADVNVTEKVARELIADAARSHLAMGTEYATRLARRLLSVLSDPDVQAGIAGVLQEHGWVYTQPVTASRCVCGKRPDDMAEHQAIAISDWLRA